MDCQHSCYASAVEDWCSIWVDSSVYCMHPHVRSVWVFALAVAPGCVGCYLSPPDCISSSDCMLTGSKEAKSCVILARAPSLVTAPLERPVIPRLGAFCYADAERLLNTGGYRHALTPCLGQECLLLTDLCPLILPSANRISLIQACRPTVIGFLHCDAGLMP